jgi:small conductance mechanosensitive channel
MEIQKFYDKLWDWILNIGPKILLAIIIFAIGEWLIRQVRKKIQERMAKKQFRSTLRPFIQSLIFGAFQIILVLLIMQIVGIHLTIFAAVIAAFSAAAGFALSGTLQNFASGILILALRPFNLGDNIIAQNQEGTVSSIQLFYTIVTTFDNRSVILPNSKLSNEVIINITRDGKRRLDLTLKFNYGIDFNTIKNSIVSALQSEEIVIQNPQIRIGISSLEPDGFICFINVWVKAHGFQDTRLTINEIILNALKNKGIKLPGM